jgi:hypothetical protein
MNETREQNGAQTRITITLNPNQTHAAAQRRWLLGYEQYFSRALCKTDPSTCHVLERFTGTLQWYVSLARFTPSNSSSQRLTSVPQEKAVAHASMRATVKPGGR